MTPVQLMCEDKVDPLGSDSATPRFSWRFRADGRDQRQTAYEIVVTRGAEGDPRARRQVWNSGKIVSSQNVQVAYAGADTDKDIRADRLLFLA